MKRNTIVAFLAVTSFVVGCSNKEKTDNAQLEADISPVIPKVASSVTEVFVDDNQFVKKGDTLLLLDDAMYKIAVRQAEVALRQAKQNVNLSFDNKGVAASNSSAVTATRIAAKANVDAAKVRYDLAEKNYNRYKALLAQKSTTQMQFDAVKAEKDTAEKLLRIAEGELISLEKQIASSLATVSTSEQGVALAEIAVQLAENNLELAKLQLSYCTITAPCDGIVSKKSVQKGQVVAVGQPLMAITDNSNVWVVANFKETQLTQMKVNQKATIKVDAFPDQEYSGTVQSIAQATGAKFSLLPQDNATGNFVKVTQRVPVKIIFSEGKASLSHLRAGMNVEVKVITQ